MSVKTIVAGLKRNLLCRRHIHSYNTYEQGAYLSSITLDGAGVRWQRHCKHCGHWDCLTVSPIPPELRRSSKKVVC